MKQQKWALWVVVSLAVGMLACSSGSSPEGDNVPGKPDTDTIGDTTSDVDLDTGDDPGGSDETPDPGVDTPDKGTPDNGQEPPEPCETAAMTDKIEAATTAMQEAKAAYQAKRESGEQEATSAAIAYLKTKEAVSDINTDGSAIFFTWASSIRCGIYTAPMSSFVGSYAPQPPPPAPSPINAPVGSGKAAVYSTLPPEEGSQNTHQEIRRLLTNAGFDVAPAFEGPAVTLEAIRRISKLDVVYIRVDGATDDEVFAFLTGQSPTGDLCPMAGEFSSRAIGLGTTVDDDGTYFTIYPNFFKGFEFKDDSLLYFSASDGLRNDSLASVMHEKGLGVFIGWNNSISTGTEDERTNVTLFERLLQGASLGAAMTELKQEDESFGQCSIVIDDEEVLAELDYYPKLEGASIRIVTGCDEDSECLQEPDEQVCHSHQCTKKSCVLECQQQGCGVSSQCPELSCGTCADNTICDSNLKCMPKEINDCVGGWCYIPAGSFRMGTFGLGFNDDEKPIHSVTITRAFYIQETELTQGQWKLLNDTNPSHFNTCGDDCPVEMVDWFDAANYANQLSENEGFQKCYQFSNCGTPLGTNLDCVVTFAGLDCRGYRLPTEAEWEYAARAGTTSYYYGDVDEIAWYYSTSHNRTERVGQKTPNAWGLYDVSGNVCEWVNDFYSATYYEDHCKSGCKDPLGPSNGWQRVHRGCGFDFDPDEVRSASRDKRAPNSGFMALGFRLVRTVTEPEFPPL
ncbi:MAG TPA: SUMF1/EgtB/PvdO family nonheme iron enzyme [Myxococcota bacterium]|nr:SUMF1/EgtB/PvdO family nonheme iron enzyme [Myxococcota bacterium]HPC91996.1 SUMF1/EgtB/PvdO family nonheme iron enzyme [Myxococcota bacterium]HPL24663.1 SUMF1/EgtB/PvdO family nonheme iron enzyme [Myxococcota bacterium]